MRFIKLIIEYDGTDFCGYQSQGTRQLRTVQDELEKALRLLTGAEIRVNGASRTDAGVHALGQVVNFAINTTIPTHRFPLALNGILPGDLVVREAVEVPPDFHARFDARSKTYIYRILNVRIPSAFWHRYAYFVARPLDVAAMRSGAEILVGRHDFHAFCAAGSPAKTFTRTLFKCKITERRPLVEIEVSGDGFLYNMVRIIAGTLVEIGLSKRDPAAINEALQTGERIKAGITAPPHGLCLVKVEY